MRSRLASTYRMAAIALVAGLATAAAHAGTATAPRVAPANSARAGTLTPEMVVGMRAVGEVAISPDAKRVAYVVSVPRALDEAPGVPHQEIWVMSTAGGVPRRYTPAEQRAWAPAFSPDGTRLAFISTRPTPVVAEGDDDSAGLFVLDLDGGEARLVAGGELSVAAFRWSPDGSRFAFTAKDAKSEEEKKDTKEGRDFVVVDRNLKPQRLWAVDLATGTVVRVTTNDASVWSFDWSPDGQRLVLQATESPRVDDNYMHSAVVLVPATGGVPAPLVPTRGKLEKPVFSPSGKFVAWLGATDLNDPFPGSVFVAPAAGGSVQEVTRGRTGVATAVGWVDDGTLVVGATRGTETVLDLVPRRGGTARTLFAAGPVFTEISLARGGKSVAFAASTPSCPAEVYASGLGGGSRPRRLTTTNPAIESVQLAVQEVVRWKATDGLEIEGLLTQPLGYAGAGRHPLVVLVHGGPESCHRNGWLTTSGYPAQVLAARGYAVLMANYRGSIGRSEAFERGDHGDLMGAEFADLLAGIDALVQRGLVDPDRVGIAGGSYGGYATAWAATAHSPRFAAAISFAGITNWISMQGTSDIPEENALVHWNRPFYDSMDLYWERSPLARVRECRTPLLLLHGEKDARVPIGQATELYTALRLLGREVEFVRYPREAHGLKEAAHQYDMLQRSLDWFDRHLKPDPSGVTTRR